MWFCSVPFNHISVFVTSKAFYKSSLINNPNSVFKLQNYGSNRVTYHFNMQHKSTALDASFGISILLKSSQF